MTYLTDAEHTRLLEAMEPATAAGGDPILRKGSPSRSLLVVEEGEVDVVDESMGEVVVLATVGAGGVVGEVGFVDGRPRTHDVQARSDCRLRRLTRDRFLDLVKDDPALFAKLAVALAELVARRFRAAVAELEPVRAFAATLAEPMEPDEPREAAGAEGGGPLARGETFDEIDEPLPEAALDLIREVARKAGRDVAGV